MKKLIAILMALVLVLSLVACGTAKDTQTDIVTDEVVENDVPAVEEEVIEPEVEVETEEEEAKEPGIETNTEIASNGALEVLNAVWALYGEDEMFPIMGGNPEGGLMDQPGVWDPAMLENLTYTTQLPAEQVAEVAEAATMIHMMNANTFTAVVYGLAEGVDAGAFAQAVRDGVQSAQWMCGFPELLHVAAVGEYVVVAYGLTDAVVPFQTHLAEAFPEVQVLFDETIG